MFSECIFFHTQIKSGSLGVGENAELSSDAVTITEFVANPWEEFSTALCKKEANKKVIDTNQEKSTSDSDDEYDDDDDDEDLDEDNEVLDRDIDANENGDVDSSSYDDEDERIIERLENDREIKLGNKKGHSGIKDKEFLAEEVQKDEELDDDIVDCE